MNRSGQVTIGKLLVFGLFFGSIQGCNKDSDRTFVSLPDGPIKHHLIVVGFGSKPNTIYARGFSGAVEPDTEVELKIGDETQKQKAGAHGRFFLQVPQTNWLTHARAELIFNKDNQIHTQTYLIKSMYSSLASAVDEPIANGQDLSDILISSNVLYLVASTDSALSAMPLDRFWRRNGEAKNLALFHPQNDVAARPNVMALLDKTLAVTLRGLDAVAGYDLQSQKSTFSQKLHDRNQKPLLFDVNPTLTLDSHIDALGNGHLTNNISRTYARCPEAIQAVDGNHLLVTFSNYFVYAQNGPHPNEAKVGPGIVAWLSVRDGQLETKDTLILPYKNPQFLMRDEDGNFWVQCSGVWSFAGDTMRSISNSGLIKLSLDQTSQKLSIAQNIALERFSPAQPAFSAQKIIVPVSFGPEVLVLPILATHKNQGTLHSAGSEAMLTLAQSFQGDLVLLGDLKKGLILFDAQEEVFFPWPFTEAISLFPKERPGMVQAPTKIVIRDKRPGVDFMGFGAMVLSASRMQIVPVDFLKIFGPY